MDGITYLFKILKQDGNASKAPICRAIILMSHFMIENAFWNTTSKFLKANTATIGQSIKNTIQNDKCKKIGMSKAIEQWPQLLTGKSFDFSHEPFSSMKCLIKERNDITHQDRISYYSYYIDSFNGATSAYFTALECAKKIRKHFDQDHNPIYSKFEKVFPPASNEFFQKALNNARNNSIIINYDKQILDKIKTLDCYNSAKLLDFKENIKEIYKEDFNLIFSKLGIECEYHIDISKLFINKLAKVSTSKRKSIFQKLMSLFKALKRKRMLGKYGVAFGEVLPHIRLKINRIPFENHLGYMCMPSNNYSIIFIIHTDRVAVHDLMKIA